MIETNDQAPTLSLYQSLARVHGTIEDLKAEAEKLIEVLKPYCSYIFHTDIININPNDSKPIELTFDKMTDVKRLKNVLDLIRAMEIQCGEEAGYKLTNDNFNELTIKESKRLTLLSILNIIIVQCEGINGLNSDILQVPAL